MAAGLLGGAMAGLGEAMQDVAKSSLKEKRERALAKLKEQAVIRAEEREGKRTAAATAAEWAREDQQRQQDREWEVMDSKRDHARDVELQRLRNQRGYGIGGGPTANMREAQWLVDQGIAPDLGSAWPMVSSRADQSGESIDYVESRIEELESVLKDPTVLYEGVGSDDANEEEIQAAVQRRAEQLRSELEFFRGKRDELAARRYDIRPPGLLNPELLNQEEKGSSGSGGGSVGQPAPSPQQSAGGTTSVEDILNSVLR